MADDRRLGRPSVGGSSPSVGVHLRLPTPQYDRLCQRATAAGVSVPELLRRELQRTPADEDEED